MNDRERIMSLPGFKVSSGSGFPVLSAEWFDLNGPFGGDIYKVKWCRRKPGRLWAGSGSGCLFVREESMSSWKRIIPPISPRSCVVEIEVSQGARPRVLAAFGGGILLGTEDDGLSWNHCGSGLPGTPIRCMAVHPIHPGVVLAGTDSGVYLSPDGGMEWTAMYDHAGFKRVTAIGFDPEDAHVFYIADFNGYFPRVFKTIDGGASFRIVLVGGGKFTLVHSLIVDPRDRSVWVAGINGAWGIAHSSSGEPNTWTPIHSGIPALRVSALAGPVNACMWAGTDGAGLYRLEENSTWKRIDIDPSRRYVKSLDAHDGHLAAGFLNAGTAIWSDEGWHSQTAGMTARWIDRTSRVSNRLFALSENRLFERTENGGWSPVAGFRQVRDICSAPGKCLALDSEYRLYAFQASSETWVDRGFPHRSGILIRSTPSGDREMVITLASGQPIRFFSSDSKTKTWNELGGGIDGPLEIYDAVIANDGDGIWAAAATVAGLYTFSERDPVWRRHIRSAGPDIRVLAVSVSRTTGLYAGAGNTLLLSENGGTSFEPGYLARFPSDIRAIAVTGRVLDALRICTVKGGIYLSFRPGAWNTLTPEETGIPINHLLPGSDNESKNILSTGGSSVIAMALPSLRLRWDNASISADTVVLRLYLALDNPTCNQEAEFHLIGLPNDGPAIFYRFENGTPEPSSEPSPLPITLKRHTQYPEVYIGSISISVSSLPFLLVSGLFRKHTWEPIAEIKTIKITPHLS